MKKFLLLVVTALLLACSKPGSEYLGQWVNTGDAQNTLEIVRNGEGFLVKETRPALFGGQGETRTNNMPAVLRDDVLQMQTALGAISIGHIKESDTLTVPGLLGISTEYRRAE